MLRKKDLAFESQAFPNKLWYVKLLLEPQGHGQKKGGQPSGSKCDIGLQEPFKFYKRFVVKNHIIQVLGIDLPLLQTELNRIVREAMVVLDPRKALLLSSRYDASVSDEARSTVMIVS
jgi:hypothetical protein